MSLPQNILPLNSDPVQNCSKRGKVERSTHYLPQARIRELLATKRKDGIVSLSDISKESGISRGYLSMFLSGYEVGQKIILKLRDYLKIPKRKPRDKKDKRIFPGPGYWYQDAI